MKITIVSHSDAHGGAARAAYRLHRAMVQQGVDSHMRVRQKITDDWRVIRAAGKVAKMRDMLRPALGNIVMNMQKSQNSNLHTGNWLPSSWAKEINSSSADLINLHWVAGETISIEDIGRINKPLVWTLHDMWPFCGAEHYTQDDAAARWRSGYYGSNRAAGDRRLDMDRLVWLRKRRAWKRKIHIIAPSNWLADCARNSVLFHNLPVTVIPNPLDTRVYQPLDKMTCRKAFDLPAEKMIILFGAMGGGRDPRKGYAFLIDALDKLASVINPADVMCVVFGQSEPKNAPRLPFMVHWVGHINDDITLSVLYSAVDVMVVPSLQENLPQTATEPQSCGCPVVSFDCTGFRDAIVHKSTGYLAKAYDADDLANGIRWILADEIRRADLGRMARERALTHWSVEAVIPQYLAVYSSAIENR